MTEQRRTALKELQKLDLKIRDAKQSIADFDPRFEEVEEPALVLESELNTSSTRLKEMKLEARRLELSTEEKRERQKKLEERLGSVRNLREEAAVSAEMEMVRRALQHDEQETLTLADQIGKVEDRLEEVAEAHKEAISVVEPQKEALLAEREQAKKDLTSLEGEREAFVAGIPADELRVYDAIRDGGKRVAVAELEDDGACSNCFGVVPLQQQNEVRHGDLLIRCESCGVILAAPEPESEKPAEEEAPVAEADDEDGDAAEEAEGDDDGDDASDDTGDGEAAADGDDEEE